MTNEYEGKREQIIEILYANSYRPWDGCKALADQILSLVEIKSDDQETPESPYHYYSKHTRTHQEERNSYCDIGYSRAVDDMLKAGFIRVVPKPIKEEKD